VYQNSQWKEKGFGHGIFIFIFNLGFLFSNEISIPMKSSIDQKTLHMQMILNFSRAKVLTCHDQCWVVLKSSLGF
jgi:hypothetical protein